MATKLFKSITVKAVGDDPANPNGTFEAVLSTDIVDRDGEIVDTKAFEPLPDSIPILADHDNQVRSLVARAVPYYDTDGVLKAKGYFASHEFAQYVRSLLVDKVLNTMSVGFKGTKALRNGATHIIKGELFEASFVVIPANREAFVTMAKSFGEGAGVETKAFTGSYEELSETLGNALRAANEGMAVWTRATFGDRVVYTIASADTWEEVGTFEASYTLDENGDVTLGDPIEVEIEQVISPKAIELSNMAAKGGRRNSSKDQSALQTAHDALAKAGAVCETKDEGTDTPKGVTSHDEKGLGQLELQLALLDADLSDDEFGWANMPTEGDFL